MRRGQDHADPPIEGSGEGSGGRRLGSAAVELLEPNARLFGVDAGGDGLVSADDDVFDDEPPRPRWLTAAAVAGIAALLAGGVVAASPWSGDATSPTTVPTTVPATAPSTTVPAIGTPGAPGLVLDPAPSGFTLENATNDVGIGAQDTGWGEVWAAPGATRTDGTWFSLTLLPFRAASTDGEPVDVGGRPGWVTDGLDGVSTLQFDAGQTDADRLVMISAHGLDRDRLVALGASVAIVDDRPQLADDRPDLTDPALVAGLEQVAAASTDRDLLDRDLLVPEPRSATLYHHAGNDGVVLVEEVPAGQRLPGLAALSATRIPSLPDGWGVSAEFRGDGLVLANRLLFGRSVRVATWLTDNDATEVVVLSSLDLDDFVRELHLVRRATSDEWRRAITHESTPSDTTVDPADVGFVVGDDRTEWEVVRAGRPTVVVKNLRRFEVWATEGADRTDGTWVSVHAPVTPVLSVDPTAVRVRVGDDVGVLTTADDGVSTLRIGSFDDGVEITSFGWTLADVVALAATASSGGQHPVDVAAVRPDLGLVMSGVGEAETLDGEIVRGQQPSSTLLRRADGAEVQVVVEADSDEVRAILPFVVGVEPGTATEYHGGGPWQSVLTFVDDGQRVLVFSTLAPDDLTALARRLQRADPTTWAALVELPRAPIETPAVDPVPVAEGATASGVAWTVEIDRLTGAAARVGFEITDGTAGVQRSFPLGTDTLTLGQTGPATVAAFRFTPDDLPVGASAVVLRGDGWTHTAALVDLVSPHHLQAAALVFSELGGFTWQLVDASGSGVGPVVASS